MCDPPSRLPEDALPIPFQDGHKWGFRSLSAAVVISPRYSFASEFLATGIAAVFKPGAGAGWVYIDTTGRELLHPFVVDNGPDYFVEGLARFVDNGKIGYFDKSGCVVVEARFDAALPFSEDRAAVCDGCRLEHAGSEGMKHRVWRGARWGYIDRTGALVVPLRFDDAHSFEGGSAAVSFTGRTLRIDLHGRILN